MSEIHSGPGAAERIQDYLDGALSPAETRAFEARVEASPELRAEVEAWSALLRRLDGLPRLAPTPGFAARVLAGLRAAPSPAVRVRRWLAALVGVPPRGRPAAHPSPGWLQDHAEGLLAPPLAARIDVHLEGCPHCRAQVSGWRGLFESLGALPTLEPSPDFAARVMAALPDGPVAEAPAIQPLESPRPRRRGPVERLGARIRSLPPRSRAAAWTLAGTAAAAPAAALAAVTWYLVTHPFLTPGNLLSFAVWRGGEWLAVIRGEVMGRLLDLFVTIAAALPAPGLREDLSFGMGLAAGAFLLFCLASALSVRVLWRNLLVPGSGRGRTHAPA